jgi:hypothetical protein
LTSRESTTGGLTDGFGIGLPLEGASDRITVTGNKDTQGTGARPTGDQKLVFANNGHEGFDWPRGGVRDLSHRQQLKEGRLIEVDHVVVLAVRETEILAYSSGGESWGRSCGQRDFLGIHLDKDERGYFTEPFDKRVYRF